MLKLMYITNNINFARAAEETGVDRIFIDLETLNKKERQKGRNTFISTHKAEDVAIMRSILKKSQLLVRVNPINELSEEEINFVIDKGADIVMLPMFKSRGEVEKFIDIIGGRCSNMLLLEHVEAVKNLDDVLNHELGGHKKHWEVVRKYQQANNISELQAKNDLEEKLRNYVLNQETNDIMYIRKNVSQNAQESFKNTKSLNELIADCIVLNKQNSVSDEFLDRLVMEVLGYDG